MNPNKENSQWSRRTFMKATLGGGAMAMLDEFYAQRGWDMETKKPGAETLKRLGLSV